MAIIPLIKEMAGLKKALNEKGFDAYRHTYLAAPVLTASVIIRKNWNASWKL